jgi:hypothetical protein
MEKGISSSDLKEVLYGHSGTPACRLGSILLLKVGRYNASYEGSQQPAGSVGNRINGN